VECPARRDGHRGPRPLPVSYLGHYTPEQARRHEVRPGITGWAAVRGRHAISFEDRLKLDVWYIDNWSIALDLRIILLTVLHLLTRRGVSAVERVEHVRIPDRFWAEGVSETVEHDLGQLPS